MTVPGPEAPAAPVTARPPRALRPSRELLDALNDRLHDAVAADSRAQIDAVLRDIRDTVGSGRVFATRFRNNTAVSGLLIGRVMALGLHLGLAWDDETGLGEIRPAPERKPYQQPKIDPVLTAAKTKSRAAHLAQQPKRGLNRVGDVRKHMRGHNPYASSLSNR